MRLLFHIILCKPSANTLILGLTLKNSTHYYMYKCLSHRIYGTADPRCNFKWKRDVTARTQCNQVS